ncbi:MAG: hypothetical protein HY290_20145 [Planctomycetia bacterium]|nr:hypothetical protein [Planctomycetia bacterium]
MSRMLKPAATGLAICSLCLSFIAEVPAQSGAKKKTAVVRTNAEEEPESPPARPRTRPAAEPADEPAPKSPGSGAKAGSKTGKLSRPEAQEMRVEKISPELEAVLKEWERQTSQFKKLAGSFSVFQYDPTFEIERRGEGTFVHEAPDKGNYERKGAVIAKGEKSKKKGKDGERYTLQALDPERWVCNGKEIIRIDEKEKSYEKIPIPPEAQGQKIIEGPLPFLFGMKAEDAKKRYKMKLLKREETQIWLEVIPVRRSDASNWDKAIVIIDARKFVPNAVQLFDPTGSETVHVFKDVEINPKREWWGPDPFKPNLNLRGYKPAISGDLQSSAKNGKAGAAAKKGPPAETPKRTANGADAPARKAGTLK